MIHALQEFAGLPWAMMPVRLAALAEGLVRLVVDQRGLGGEAFTTRSVVVQKLVWLAQEIYLTARRYH